MKKKGFLPTFITLFILMLFIIIFVYSGKNEKITPEEPEQLTFRITWESHSGRGDAIQKIINNFNSENENINVQMIGGDEDHEEIISLLSTEASSNILVLPYRELKNQTTLSYLYPIGNYMQDELKYYYPEILKLGMDKNGVVYGIPWIGHSMCFIYNKNIIDELNIDVDSIRDFNSFKNVLAEIKNNSEYTGIGLVGAEHHDLSWMTTQFIYSFGGSLYDESENRISINSTETEMALDYYVNILSQYAQTGWEENNGVDVMAEFLKGNMAFEIQGPWGITDIWKNGRPFDVGTISFSQLGGFSETGPLMLCVSEAVFEQKKEAILKFMKYMLGKEALEEVMLGEFSPKHQEYYPFRVPVRNDMENGVFFRTYPEFKAFTEGFENPSLDMPVPEWTEIREKIYIPQLHQVIIGELSIDEFLENVEKNGEKLLSEKPVTGEEGI